MTLVFSSLNHPQRVPLAAELHSRPILKLRAPELVSHLAVFGHGRGDNADAQHVLLMDLCRHFGVAAPARDANHFFHDFGRFRLKWELHSEFATYTFAERAEAASFERMPVQHVPQDWLLQLTGRVMVAAHVILRKGGVEEHAPVFDLFEGVSLAASRVMHCAELCSDFAIASDGFARFVVNDVNMREQQAGRLVQRVLEIETYRMMALYGLPAAQRAVPELNAVEKELAEATGALLASDDTTEQALLQQITLLAARIEKLSLDNSYRFAASKAYFRLVNARIDELREERIEGVPTVAEFMERRLAPAMNTCEAVAARQDALARRIANSNDLLRTRVGIVQETQNRQILQSMNARAAQQLRLQQAVEGLSVAAISYYVVGLIGYAVKGAKVLGWVANPDALMGAAVPFVAAAVWLALRSMHRRLHRH
ncbi:DUF3422 family protein [Pseudoduganella plicata]|uniref:DUF3422 family protein n=1 Tax=Pseudoduganella plicata TaxID=321984 RepID=A0A4P7BCG4_9BURK|nr:DUF3422 domain-containing protein [Pseudoduganella plicata]QBQ35793.1 DUF3422 family protein [Pseudoduganella plicata]GGY94999.1 hypothetical protein GCM10007388_30430 [Pseudoduganella plicata]